MRKIPAAEKRAVCVRTLRRAPEVLGTKDRLRERLRVSMTDLDDWLAGRATPPMHAFLSAVDVISAPWGDYPRSPAGAIQRAQRLVHYNALLRATSECIIGESRAILGLIGTPARVSATVEAALDEALAASGAERGNVQLLSSQGLRIVAHRGFTERFLEFFAVVPHGAFGCGAALT